jgi:N-6 DNA methylase
MPRKRDVLEALKREELVGAVDGFDVPVRDRRFRDELIEALTVSRRAGLTDILEGLSRNRLKEICRALDLDDSGREKAVIIARLAGRDSSPADSPGEGSSPRGGGGLALGGGQERGVVLSHDRGLSTARSKPHRRGTMSNPRDKSLESWIWDAACSIRGAQDRMDFNATTHGQRDIDDDRLSNLIERISEKRLGLKDVEADVIGRSYEYLIRKFAEGSGQSASEFFTPPEVARIMALIMDPEPDMRVYDPCCGSAGLLIACEHVLDDKMKLRSRPKYAPLKMYGQEYVATTWAMANMNMIIHDMEGKIEIGDTFKNPQFRPGNRLQTFDRVVSNPMWNQDWFKEGDYDADELGRFPQGASFPGAQSADWGWAQHILASLNGGGRAAEKGSRQRGAMTRCAISCSPHLRSPASRTRRA